MTTLLKEEAKLLLIECLLEELKNHDSIIDEPPAWHEAVLKEREEELKNCKVLEEDVEEVFKNLKTKVREG